MIKHVSNEALAYIEGRLAAEDTARVGSHLNDCPPCRAEVLALRETHAVLAEAGRAAACLPLPAAVQGWEAVRQRWQLPIVARVRNASRRLSWQVSASMAVAVMAFVSGISLNTARAATPGIPVIQTPAAHLVSSSDTPTLSATRPVFLSQTPTQTSTPAPVETN